MMCHCSDALSSMQLASCTRSDVFARLHYVECEAIAIALVTRPITSCRLNFQTSTAQVAYITIFFPVRLIVQCALVGAVSVPLSGC